MIWFTADTHFSHRRILEYQRNRDYATIAEMNADIMLRWNSVVADDDTVYVLGDFHLGGSAVEIKDIIARLKGTKILVKGNHDKRKDNWYRAAGFAEVLRGYQTIQLKNGDFVTVAHYPYKPSLLRCAWYALTNWNMLRFTKQMRKDDGMFLLHGHVHAQWQRKGNMLNVGWDVFDSLVHQDVVYQAMRDSRVECSQWVGEE
jgi:calcineurin-like phosphoesterase family protein